MFSGKKIIIGISGSIAAYKSILLTRMLVKMGNEVKVIMTKSALDFVSPLTLSTLSKNKVLIDLFEADQWENHVHLGRWADLMIIAPASCNTLAKMAHGICDNLLIAVYLSAACPVIVAPAMDEDMWRHASTKRNLLNLAEAKTIVLGVGTGELASGLNGEGRMIEPEEIITYLEEFFLASSELSGIKVMVTAGPTQEPLDPVRYISNYSSGKMGIAIAEEFQKKGAIVTLVLGPSSEKSVITDIKHVITAEAMYHACVPAIAEYDIIVMAAAVADYRPEAYSQTKIKKQAGVSELRLIKNRDILKAAGELKSGNQILVGFALETTNERENALGKLQDKQLDIIILNSLNDEGAGFGSDTNKITIFDKKGNEFVFDKKSKAQVAKDIVNVILKYKNA